MSDNIIIATSKEEKEKLLNIRIQQIKKKNEELLNKHKLIEEDKRQAELHGRIIKNIKSTFYHEDNEPNVRRKHSPVRKGRLDEANRKQYRGNGIPLEPAYNFLFDKARDRQNGKEEKREMTRRHPRNYGGMNFEDVPKKIQQERTKQDNSRRYYRSSEADYTMITTGKERREMDEWRKEREEIDRKRMQRQRKEDGGWRREWDQNKDSPFVESDRSSDVRSSPGEQRYFAEMLANKSPYGPQRHFNKIYHQKKKIKRNASDSNCVLHQERIHISSPVHIPNNVSHSKSGSSDCSSFTENPNRGGDRRQSRNNWKSWKLDPEQGKNTDSNESKMNSTPVPTPQGDKITPGVNSSSSSSSSPRKSVRFLDVTVEKNAEQNLKQEARKDGLQHQQYMHARSGRNFFGSGRFSGGQKFKPKGHRFKRDFRTEGDHFCHSRNQIRKVYLNEAMCKTVEVIINPDQAATNHHGDLEKMAESHKPYEARKPEESSGKSDEEEYEEGEDEDEQWEDIDEEVCLELDHGRDEGDLGASSESLDKFIINNTLVLDASETISNNLQTKNSGSPNLDLLDGGDPSMGPQGGYPSILDWEYESESNSHLSDVEKTCNTSESSIESNLPSETKNNRETGLEESLKAVEESMNEDLNQIRGEEELSVSIGLLNGVNKGDSCEGDSHVSDDKENLHVDEVRGETLQGNDSTVCGVISGDRRIVEN